MSIDAFVVKPWQNSHSAYDASVFSIQPAPEYATAEVMVASLYRASGFDKAMISENHVPVLGRKFERAKPPSERAASGVSESTWRTVLHGVLSSPKQPNQSSKRFLQLSPVIPDAALYSGSARLSGNSWNPGALVRATIVRGSVSQDAAMALWGSVHAALSVTDADDIWARWLQEEFKRRKASDAPQWTGTATRIEELSSAAVLSPPARQFVRDLTAILATKEYMTRRQWLTLLESILRIGTVAHVLHQCHANDVLWRSIRGLFSDGLDNEDIEAVPSRISVPEGQLSYGRGAVPRIRDLASRYLMARLGINLTLWQLNPPDADLSTAQGIIGFLREVASQRASLGATVLSTFESLRDREARTVACKKGIGSNIVEFARHTLGQRRTAAESLRGYDQGYILRKSGQHPAAPWIVSLGPVAVLAIVHCCLSEVNGPRSVQRLRQHLESYGISVERADISRSDLGRKLRMLGLILDSPDAESGMLLIPPFQTLSSLAAYEE